MHNFILSVLLPTSFEFCFCLKLASCQKQFRRRQISITFINQTFTNKNQLHGQTYNDE